MTPRPTGTVTFLFTDVEGSTKAWEASPAETRVALQRHDDIAQRTIEAHQGAVVLERGEGDSIFAVFARATDAVAAACELQRALAKEQWPVPVHVRVAIHTGEANADYRGPHVNRAARLRSIGHGGQILISGVTAGIVRGALPAGASLIDLGQHRLRDVAAPEHVFQLIHPDLRRDFSPLKSVAHAGQNLPVQLTSFVGRENERANIRELIGTNQLVTLLGPGGCGKTRLAIQVGTDAADGFPDGVHFVDLAPLNDGSVVPEAIGSALGAKPEQGVAIRDVIAQHLDGKRTLIILDNCEHVIAACAEAIPGMLRSGAGVRILTTSREPLRFPGERKCRVRPLFVPSEATSEEMARSEAVQLFIDRAIAARPGFSASAGNINSIAEICRIVEGLPLAIELAAARTKILAPQEICHRLCDRFRLLTGGRGRHQTLRSTIDWSYDLLSPAERALFRRLSVFAGDFDLAGAEAVWTGDTDALDLLEQLVEKSLVIIEQSKDDTLRYRLLDTLRQYGTERVLELGEEQNVRDQHFHYYLEVAEQAYRRRIEEEVASLDRLEMDHDNFRAALQWARTRPRDLLRLASALGWFWHLRCHYREGRAWLQEALDVNPNDRSREMARGLWALTMILNWKGESAAARPLADRSVELWREADDPLELALALESIGWSQYAVNDYAAALTSMEECVQSYRDFGSAKLVTRGRVAAGQMLAALGEVERTERLARETLEEGRVHNEPKFIHYSLHYLADCALWRGDPASAVHLYADSLRAALDYGNDMEAAVEMQGMAMALAGSGRELEGLRLFGAACAHLEELQTTMVDDVAFWVNFRERYLSPARLRIGQGTAGEAEKEGRAMGWNEALSFSFELAGS